MTRNAMNTDQDLAGAQIDKFTLDLMAFHFMIWCETSDDEDILRERHYGICPNSFVGATEYEALCCIAQMLIDAYLALGRNENPFDYGESKEMAWSELFDFTMGFEEDNAYEGHGLLHLIKDICPSLEFENDHDLENISCVINDHVCFDHWQTLFIFYPHAWSDYFENAKNGNLARKLIELEFVWDGDAQKLLEEAYCQSHRKLEAVSENTSKTKKQNQNKEIKQKPKKPTILHKHLYLMKCDRTGHYKIGISIDPKHREATLQSEKPSIRMVGQWERMAVLEKRWHNYFASNRLRGEWFDLSKCQVQFMCSLMKKQIDDILQIIDPSSQATA